MDFIDDLILMKILGKLLNNIKEDNTGNTHDAQCSTCGMKPIENLDRYHCLICSTSQLSYDLCGRCFEKRLLNHKHLNGHPMIHFKLPNEYLGIIVYDIKDVYLNEIRKLRTLIDERHDGIKCDGICNQSNIKGLRFKCDTCHNYNLCDPCALIKQITTKNHQSDHPIILTSNRNIPKIDHNDIELGQILGRGGFGMLLSLFVDLYLSHSDQRSYTFSFRFRLRNFSIGISAPLRSIENGIDEKLPRRNRFSAKSFFKK